MKVTSPSHRGDLIGHRKLAIQEDTQDTYYCSWVNGTICIDVAIHVYRFSRTFCMTIKPNEFSFGGIEFESYGRTPYLNFMDAVEESIFSRGDVLNR